MYTMSDRDFPGLRARLLGAVEHMAADLVGATSRIDEARQLPDDVVELLSRASLFRMLTAQAYDGLEVDVHTFVLVIERLARANASAAWCTFIACTATLVVGRLPQQEAKFLLREPVTRMAGVFAPKGRAVREIRDGVEGFLVTGRWAWASACRHAHYISGGCVVIDAAGQPEQLESGAPHIVSAVFAAQDVEIFDTWHTAGLRGTGSDEFAVNDLFVPQTRVASLFGDAVLPIPLFKFPVFGLLALGISAVALGIARQAMDSLMELSLEKTPDGSARLLAERGTLQVHFARCQARLGAARAYLLEAVDAAWLAAARPGAIQIHHRASIRLASTFATEEATAIVDRMHNLAGGSSVFQSSTIQHCLADIHAATQHMMVSESTYELVGRVLLGLSANVTTL